MGAPQVWSSDRISGTTTRYNPQPNKVGGAALPWTELGFDYSVDFIDLGRVDCLPGCLPRLLMKHMMRSAEREGFHALEKEGFS